MPPVLEKEADDVLKRLDFGQSVLHVLVHVEGVAAGVVGQAPQQRVAGHQTQTQAGLRLQVAGGQLALLTSFK